MSDAVGDPEARLDELVRAAAESRRRGGLRHPETDDLVNYSTGALSPAEDESIQEHLALCNECAQLVLDLRAILAPPREREEQASPALVQEWERLRARLDRRPLPPVDLDTPFSKLAWLLAASLVVTLGLLTWDLGLYRSLELARQPLSDLQLVDLAPLAGGAERSPEHPVEVAVAPLVRKVALLLNLGELRSFPRYTVTLVDPDDRVAWRAPAAWRGEDGTFVLEVPRQSLATLGPYRIVLDGRSGGATTRLATYAFMVVH